MAIPTLALCCLLYGFAFALFAPFVILPFTAPVIVLSALLIWALPSSRRPPTRSLELLFFSFFITLIVWPNYLALDVSGLPWITMIRLTGLPMLVVLLLCVSTSRDFRAQLGNVLDTIPLLWKLLVLFVILQLLSIGLSSSPAISIQKFVLAQIGWTAVFFASCVLFLKPGRVELWAAVLWFMSVVVGIIGIIEYVQGQIPWAGHIPDFLRIEDPAVLRILAPQTRTATEIYRVHSTFSTSLTLAEYIALTVPFILHFSANSYRWPTRLAAIASLPFLFFVVLLTDSRLGVVGFLLATLLYLFFGSVIRWSQHKTSLFGPSIVIAYPVLFSLAIASTFFVGRVRARVWGNGPQQFSDDSRREQYETGIQMILNNPLGHGIGMGAETLGFLSPSGVLTIDTYYIVIGLEYGVLGIAVYYGMILLSIWLSSTYALRAGQRNREYEFLTPVAIALTNFFVIKSVLSLEDNHPLIFMMMGIVVALIYRIRNQATSNHVREG